jgi:opacity protein-like surface antigen
VQYFYFEGQFEMSNKKELIAATAASVAALAAAATSASAADAGGGHDWSGFYVGMGVGAPGGQLAGAGDGYTDYGLAAPQISGFVGFNQQLDSNIVLGGELNVLGPTAATGHGTDHGYGLDFGFDAKAKLGYDLGRFMIYGFAGASTQKTSIGDYGDAYHSYGFNVGIGADAKITDHMLLGVEWTHRQLNYNHGGSNVDAGQDSIALRASYLFN